MVALRALGICAAINKWERQYRQLYRARGLSRELTEFRMRNWTRAAVRFKAALLNYAEWHLKAGFDPSQPRWPAGSGEISGRWSAGSGPQPPPGMGHNKPPVETPPEIPRKAPPTTQDKNGFVKTAARWLLKATTRGALGPIGLFAAALEAQSWLEGDLPRIEAYAEGPKSLAELQSAVASPRWGYDIHHVAERTSARRDGFPPELINGPENLVRIPTLKHWEINGWYATPNPDFGGLTPRQYLQGKDWSERTRVGHQALIKFGVLKP